LYSALKSKDAEVLMAVLKTGWK